MSPKEGNIFERHPKGAEILQRLLTKPPSMTMTKAGEILGCTTSNVSQILKKYKHLPDKEERRKEVEVGEIERQLEELQVIQVQLDQRTPPKKYAATSFQVLQQKIMQMLLNPSLLPEDFIKLANLAIKIQTFQLKEDIYPEIERDELELSDDVKEMVDKVAKEILEDHDNWCPFRKKHVAAIDKETRKERLESTESSSLGR